MRKQDDNIAPTAVEANKRGGHNKPNYQFTDSEMLEIVRQINRKPVNKSKIIELLFNGSEGGAK